MTIRKSWWQQVLFCALLLSRATGGEPVQSSSATLSQLQEQLAAIVEQPKYASALWGVKIISLDTGKTLFEANAGKLFSPASNCKLYTIALALDRLGPGFRIRTSLYADSRPDKSGVLHGDLVVYGRGDPTINARLHDDDIFEAIQPLVSALTNAGIREITGDLVGDSTFIRGPEYGSGWTCDDAEYYYGAEISALTVNDNTLRVTVTPGKSPGSPCELAVQPAPLQGYVGFSNLTETVERGSRRISFYRPLSENVIYARGRLPINSREYSDEVTVHEPAGMFVLLFKEALARQGISVNGRLRTRTWLNSQARNVEEHPPVELGSMESPPVSELATLIAKPSQNLYADLLLAQVGEKSRTLSTSPTMTSEDLGIGELNRFLGVAGVREGDTIFEEGSGLSRNNLTTPEATVALLQFMHRGSNAQIYLNALPIAGVDGTLRRRMKGTPAEGNVRAKTGTLRWAYSLSGYVTTAAGEHLAFSIMLNRFHNTDPSRSGRADLDKIAELLAGFSGRSD